MSSISDEIVKLGDLLDRGLLTRAEFEALKAQLLDGHEVERYLAHPAIPSHLAHPSPPTNSVDQHAPLGAVSEAAPTIPAVKAAQSLATWKAKLGISLGLLGALAAWSAAGTFSLLDILVGGAINAGIGAAIGTIIDRARRNRR